MNDPGAKIRKMKDARGWVCKRFYVVGKGGRF